MESLEDIELSVVKEISIHPKSPSSLPIPSSTLSTRDDISETFSSSPHNCHFSLATVI